MKNVYVFILIIFCCLSAVNKTMAQSGTTGTCDWALSGTSPNYTLTIKPTNGVTGAMDNYTSSSQSPWYSYRSGIKTLDIQQGVTNIGNYSFYNCSRITSVTIPSSVTTIGDHAFYNCDGLTSLTIGNSVTYIGNLAFYSCDGLTSITIGNSVTTIENSAFRDCENVTSISVDANNTAYSSVAGVLFNKNQTTLICYPIGKTGSYTIPNSVTSIEDYAFYYCEGLTSVTIGNLVTSIGDHAFSNCDGLTSLTIGNSVTTIGENAFYGCDGLTSITIPNSVTTIGRQAFVDCKNLTSISVDANNTAYSSVAGVLFNKNQTTLICYPIGKTGSYTIPNTVTSIGDYAFYRCDNLTSITFPNSLKTIGYAAFFSCTSLTSVTFPNSVTYIGNLAFDQCTSVTSIMLPDSLTSTGAYVFEGTSITSITLPNSLTSIAFASFQNCPELSSVTIGNSVRTIGFIAFKKCPKLSSVTIGNSVKTIEYDAFYDCTGLTVMYVKAVNPPTLGSNAFYNVPTNIPVHVPCGSKTAYQNATGWSSFTNIIEDIPFSISLQSNNTSMGSVNVIQANNCTNTIEAIPNSCYSFVRWSDGNTQNPRTMQITSDTSVTAIFASTVVPIVANDTAVCPGTSASLTASSSASGATYKWYSSQAASSPFHTGANYTTSNLTADTTFYISVLANGCETASGDRKAVKVSVKSVPVVSAVRTEICPGLSTRIFPNKDGSWTSSDSNIVDILNSGSIVGQSAGTASLTFYDSTTACSASMNITVKAYPNPDEITGKKVVCEGKTIELSNTSPNGVWTKNNDNISFDNPQANPVKVTGVTKGNSYVTYTVSNGECKTKRTFQLKIIPVPTTPPKIIIGVER